jgi:hypothetical protein
MLAVVEVVLTHCREVLVELAAGELELLEVRFQHLLLELQIQAVAVAAVAGFLGLLSLPQAVQALSFFATPAQFNISLVVQ